MAHTTVTDTKYLRHGDSAKSSTRVPIVHHLARRVSLDCGMLCNCDSNDATSTRWTQALWCCPRARVFRCNWLYSVSTIAYGVVRAALWDVWLDGDGGPRVSDRSVSRMRRFEGFFCRQPWRSNGGFPKRSKELPKAGLFAWHLALGTSQPAQALHFCGEDGVSRIEYGVRSTRHAVKC